MLHLPCKPIIFGLVSSYPAKTETFNRKQLAVKPLTSSQMKYLRGLAHGLKPIVLIGQNGLNDAVVQAADSALNRHELIKVKFNDIKDKAQKKTYAASLESATKSSVVGMIGHIAIFYRPQKDASKRKISLPDSQA